MNDTVTGIVLRQTDYKENAALISVISREYGRFSLVAEGVRKMNSKTAGAVQPLMKTDFTFDYREDRTMFRMKGARPVSSYPGIRKDLVRTVAASVTAEICDLFTYEGSTPEIYDSLEEALRLLEEGGKSEVILTLFLAGMTADAGLSPNVDECVLCGKPEAAAISVKEGGFLCPQCAAAAREEALPLSELRTFRHAVKARITNYEKAVSLGEDYLPALVRMVEILKRHSGLMIRSFPLFLEVFSH